MKACQMFSDSEEQINARFTSKRKHPATIFAARQKAGSLSVSPGAVNAAGSYASGSPLYDEGKPRCSSAPRERRADAGGLRKSLEDTHHETGGGSNALDVAPSEKRTETGYTGAGQVSLNASDPARKAGATHNGTPADAEMAALVLGSATRIQAPSAAPTSRPCCLCEKRKPRKQRRMCNSCRSRLYDNPVNRLWRNIKAGAKRRGKSFAMPFACFALWARYSGYADGHGRRATELTVDRVYPFCGYVIANLAPLSCSTNATKQHTDRKRFGAIMEGATAA